MRDHGVLGAFNQEKALVGAFSVIVQPVVEPMEHYIALVDILAKPALAELEVLLCDSFYLVAGHSYRVVFSFAGERAGDLAVCQGELVTVVSHSDQHWCSVMNSRSHQSYFISCFPLDCITVNSIVHYSWNLFIIDNLSD